jgi:two-component system NtrC family response regulator
MLLAKVFMNRYAEENRKKLTGFTKEAIYAIERYEWPGNVRELENRIKRAVIMAEGKKLNIADLEMGTPKPKYEEMGLKEARDTLEKELVKKALSRNHSNITKAAQELSISRPTLYDLMEKFKIKS